MTLAHDPVLEAIQDGLYTLDAEWRITYWNAAAERLLGIPREVALGCALEQVLPLPEEAREQLRRVVEEREVREFVELHESGGRAFHLSVRAAPMEGGGAAVHFRDATGERTLEEQYDRLLEAMRDGFVAVDAGWRVVHINGVAESLLRLPKERAMGSDLRGLLPADLPEVEETLRATMEDGTPRHLTAVGPAGRLLRGRIFDLWTCPLPTGGISVLFQDVSEHVRRERELARLAAEAEEANRAKSRFFANASHELRTPLNAIVGYLHLLNSETYGSIPPGALRATERAGVCAEHLARLVDDVLLVTTAEIGRLPVFPAPVELERFLAGTLEPLRQQAEAKRLSFSIEVAEDAALLETDPDRLRQLLVALVGNAVKFTARGEIRIAARALPAEATGGVEALEISVCDTGPGISPEDRERIFEAFEQLGDPARSDSMTRGTGFGLTIARKLSGLLRGSLTVDEGDGCGAVFRLCLPLRFGLSCPPS